MKPNIGLLTKVIPLKPNRLSKNYLGRNGGNVIVHVLISVHNREVFCTLRLFVRLGIYLFCAFLAVHYLAVWTFNTPFATVGHVTDNF